MQKQGLTFFERGFQEYVYTLLLVLAVFAFGFKNSSLLIVGVLFTFTHLVYVIDRSNMTINTYLALGFGDRWPWSRTSLGRRIARIPLVFTSSEINVPTRIIVESKKSQGYMPYSKLTGRKVPDEYSLSIECADKPKKLSINMKREDVDELAGSLCSHLGLSADSISFISE